LKKLKTAAESARPPAFQRTSQLRLNPADWHKVSLRAPGSFFANRKFDITPLA
jgi:hypothetical protein